MTYGVLINRGGFEVELKGWDKDAINARYPFVCPICDRGTNVLIDARLVEHEFKACPNCYNNLLTEMELLTGIHWDSWYPPEQWNNGEFPLRSVVFRIRRWFGRIRKKWLRWKVNYLNWRKATEEAKQRSRLRLVELDEIKNALGREL